MTALRPRLRASALAGTVLLALAGSPLPGPALADTTATSGTTSVSAPIPLDIPAFADVALDSVRGRLFFSSGTGHDTVLVTDLAGQPVTTLTGLGGATGLAIGPHSPTMWVALADDHELVEIDLETYGVIRRVPVPGQCPGDVVSNGHHVVYGFSCVGYGHGTANGGIGVFSGSDPEPVPRVSSEGPVRRPLVDLGYEWPHTVVASESRDSTEPGSAPSVTRVYDIADNVPVAGATTTAAGLQDVSVHPWTPTVVLSATGTGSHQVLPLPGLDSAVALPTEGSPRAAAWGWHGSLATGSDNATGADVVLSHGSTGTDSEPQPVQQASFELNSSVIEPGGLVLDDHGVRAYAVVRDDAGLALRVLAVSTNTTLTGPSLAITGHAVTLTGRVTVGDAPAPEGTWLRVERLFHNPNRVPTTGLLAAVQTGPDGTYTVTDTVPTHPGPVVYRVTHEAGDATSSASWAVDVQPRLSISAPPSVEIGDAVTSPARCASPTALPQPGRP